MSLATRCTACGTAFRVVQDQLKVSEGWVRCGQCREVFSAFEQLFDLDREGASVKAEPAREPVGAAGNPAAIAAAREPAVDDLAPAFAGEGRFPPTHPFGVLTEPSSGDGTARDVASVDDEPTVEVVEIEVTHAQSESPIETDGSIRHATPSADVAASLETSTFDSEDAGPPTIYAALDEPSMMEAAAADAPVDAPVPAEPTTPAVHPVEEQRDGSDAAPLPLDLDSTDDDESPLLPPLPTEPRDERTRDAPFLAPELDSDVDSDDTIRLPEAPANSPAAAPAREPDVAVDEWAAEAAHERPSLIEKEIDAHLFGKRRHARRHAPVAHVSARDQLDFSDARFDSNLLTDGDTLEADAPPSEDGELPLETALPPATPEFLRRAERQARWHRPAVRAALSAASIFLAALLVLQTTHHFRDDLAARWPVWKPALVAWCGIASCALEAPRHIDDITVENTALARASSDAFRLAVTLRNHATVPVALPAVDLSLTDASGRLVARRALSARDFKVSPAVLPPNGEVALEAPIAARNARVSGYTVEIFYP